MNATRNNLVAFLFAFAFAFFGADKALATATITAATGGGSIPADTAANAPSPAWTTLGAITIAEGANADFAVGTNVTLILKAPSGFQFNTTVTPSISFTAGRNISSASLALTDAGTITMTLTVTNNNAADMLIIGSTTGIQVQPTAGTPLASGTITVATTSTATVAGITKGTTSLGALAEIGGAVTQLAFTTQAAGATAGAAFTTQPTVKSEDQFGNPATNGLPANSFVSVSLTSGTGPLQGTIWVNLSMSSGKGTATYSGLRIDVAGNDKQLTATSTNGLTSALSSVFSVIPAAANKLVLTTQPSSIAVAGVPFAQQPVIYIEDQYGNLRIGDTLVVSAVRLHGTGNLQGTTSIAAVGGVATFTNLAHSVVNAITIFFDSGSLTTATSQDITVNPGLFSQLQVLLPGETATPGVAPGQSGTPTVQAAGTAFSVKVSAVDAGWNPVSTVTHTVGVTSTDGTAILPANAALLNGTNSFNVTLKTTGSQTITANDLTDGTTTGTSSTVTVNAAAFAKLQLLLPGETAAPGTTTGKTGTPNTQTAGAAYTVTVNAADANWNVISTNDTVAITSSDANTTLPANAALAAGTRTFSVTNKTTGTWTVTASDTTHTGITPSTSASFTVNTGAFTKLQLLVPGETAAPGTTTGKTGTPVPQNTDTPFTVTVNGVDSNWNRVSSSDTVAMTSSDTNATLPANAALSGGTGTFSVKFNTAGGTRTVTATDASNGTKTANTSPAITVNLGAFAKLLVLMPGETAAPGTTSGKTGTPTAQTAGTSLSVTVRAVDSAWNLISTNDTVHITSSDLQATVPANAALSGGSGTFSVTFKTSGSQTVSASDVTHAGIGSATGTTATVNPAAASKLVIATQPSTTAVAGVPLAQQPVIFIEDQYSNVRSNDTLVVTATRNAGAGTLMGTTNITAVGGVAAFTNLAHPLATNITISFTSGALTAVTSTSIAVSGGPYSQLQVLLPGEIAAPGTPSGKTGTPAAQTSGTAFLVRVNAVDLGFNPIKTVADLVGISSSDATASLPATAVSQGGVLIATQVV